MARSRRTGTKAGLKRQSAGAISFRATVLLSPETVDEARNKTVNYRAPGA